MAIEIQLLPPDRLADLLQPICTAFGLAMVLEVEDDFCPWNTGRYRVGEGAATRTEAAADVTLGIDALGAAYLGGFSFTQLAMAGRATERRPGGLRRADALFRGEGAPWAPEIF